MKRKNQSFMRKYGVLLFGGLTIALSFAAYFLPLPREMVPFVIVLVPAVLAFLLAWLGERNVGVLSLLRKLARFRFSLKWWFIALGIALALRLAVSGAAILLGRSDGITIRQMEPEGYVVLAVLLFAAALLEETGWRGYVLPRLLERFSPWFASLLIGLGWGVVHLALHLPGMEFAGLPPLATLLTLTGLSFLLTWFFLHGRRSVLLSAFFRAVQSFFNIFNDGIDPALKMWLLAAVFCAAAVVVVLASRGMQRNTSRSAGAIPEPEAP